MLDSCSNSVRTQFQKEKKRKKKKKRNVCHLHSCLWISPQNCTSLLLLWRHPPLSVLVLSISPSIDVFFSPCTWNAFVGQGSTSASPCSSHSETWDSVCVTLPILMLLSICHTGGCQLCSCSPQFSLDLQTDVAKCLLGVSTWISHRHFQFSMSESSLCFFL